MTKYNHPLFIAVLIVAFTSGSNSSLPAQPPGGNISFERLSLDDPLSQDQIRAIVQDRQGTIWFGTSNGLVKYDGYQYRRFLHDPLDSTSLGMNYVTYIIEDRTEPALWLATEGGFSRFDMLTEAFRNFQPDPGNPNSVTTKSVTTLDQAPDGRIWVGTLDNGVLNGYDPKVDSFIHYRHDPGDPNTVPKEWIPGVVVDGDGKVWGLGGEGTLFRLDPATEEIRYYQEEIGKHLWGFWPFFKDRQGKVYFFTERGIFHFDNNAEQLRAVPFDPVAWENQTGLPWPSVQIHGTLLDAKGRWWWGLPPSRRDRMGLYQFDPARGMISHFKGNKSDDPGALAHPFIWTSMEDAAGRIWFGLWNEGYNYTSPLEKRMNYWEPDPASVGLPPNLSRPSSPAVAVAPDGRVWVGMGLFLVSLPTAEHPFRLIPSSPGASTPYHFNFVSGICPLPNGKLWVGADQGYVLEVDLKTDVVTPLQNRYPALQDHRQLRVCRPSEKRIWITTFTGFWEFDPKEETLSDFNAWADFADSPWQEGKLPFVKCQIPEGENVLWLGTLDQGLIRVDLNERRMRRIVPSPELQGLVRSEVNDLLFDHAGNLWIGLWGGGLYQLPASEKNNPEPALRHWRKYNSNLPSDNVYAILEDNQGKLWLSTHNGISRFDPKTGSFFNYDLEESGQGFYYAGVKAKGPDGALYFGGKRGLTYFHPDSIQTNKYIPPVQITDFFLFNERVPVAGTFGDTLGWASPLDRHISFTESITLPYWQNDIAFTFSALNYIQPENNQYAYRLEGYQDDWVYTGAGNRRANFTNLDPGKYTLRVKASNNDGLWNDSGKSIVITIRPPWWATSWAYTLYVLIAAALLYGIFRFQLRRQLEQAEAVRLKELDEVKTRLYTNITHEFRTPLTVISGMVDQVRNNPERWFREGLAMIKRNSRQLLELVNQMLDLSKLESGAMQANMQQGDVVQYLAYLVQSFQTYAASRNIGLHLWKEVDELIMDLDPDKLSKIVGNLLSNAMKYTEEGGNVYVQLARDAGTFLLKVKDTGIGIPEEQLPHIFGRFYQVDGSHTRAGEGTGIGLALVKELVNLMNGSISVKSKVDEGTEFVVRLPISRTTSPSELPAATEPLPSADTAVELSTNFGRQSTTAALPIALIIEDNKDVVQYIASCIADEHQVEIADNGQEGLEKALEIIPDVIISDVMMPGKDGYEVTAFLKNDERTSHIPIILLTAKADVDSRIEGLERGADAYLAKPFEPEELAVRIRKLLELRKRLQARYSSLAPAGFSKDRALRKEDAFLRKFRQIIEEHISDENFGVPHLCRALGISRVQLHRKLKALTGRPTALAIRFIRMQRAKALLQNRALNISEVAYEVGFKDPAYFSRVFAEEFGCSPSETRN